MEAPAAPVDREKSPNTRPDAPPPYSSHQPGYKGHRPYGLPIQTQPTSFPMYISRNGSQAPNNCQENQISWMPAPVPLANCPPGLEYLQQTKTIRVHQQIELLEILTGFETNNRYEVKNDSGQMIYFVTEDTDDIIRNRYRSSRPFTLRVTDSMDHEVMNIHRPYKFSCCCCCCCCCDSMTQELEIESPPGSVIGYVRQNGSFCQGKFRIENERKDHLMNIISNCFCCCSDTIFKVKSLHQQTVGTIIREWPGPLTNITADTYDIHFELDDVKMKALILGACFLIDFMYFENKLKKSSRNSINS
ncbi:phospholipid scramblase 4-like isoform X1 [Antechinus flavipes]|uniref:phospholipid scramblase 4-like isoform X1 n=2 Tax=Antechinus flavipes TaxID=38775 RepID=UPI002235CD85|nr:phospholipid scramblase 4-like isoform X1 [Antechinus flavipes]